MNPTYEKNSSSHPQNPARLTAGSHPEIAANQAKMPLPAPKEQLDAPTSITWQALEYEKAERTKNWYIGAFIFIFLMVAYAFFTDNLLMAVIFILFAVLAYLFDKKSPRTIKFSITDGGVSAHDNFYEYSSLESFWIFYEPMGTKVLSLKSKRKYLAYLHLPLGQANPADIRRTLLRHIPEEKQTEGLVDALEKLF